MSVNEKNLKSFSNYLQILGGTTGILAVIGYLSERFHNNVLGIEVDISSGDFAYRGGMFFFNSFFAVFYGILSSLNQSEWLLPLLLFLTFVSVFVVAANLKLSKNRVLWPVFSLLVLTQGVFIIREYISVMPGQNLLLYGENPYNQTDYGRLLLLSSLYICACWQIFKWMGKEGFHHWYSNLLKVLLGILVVFQLLLIPLYYGALSNPNEYPIALVEYGQNGKETYYVALLGEKYGRLVTYNPRRKIMLLERSRVGTIEVKGNKDIFNPKNYPE